MKASGTKDRAGAAGRKERLAVALRENLRKRKAQVRSRARRGGAKITGIRPENDTDSSEKR